MGIRTRTESRGGVMPRRICGLSSADLLDVVAPLAFAIAASGVAGPDPHRVVREWRQRSDLHAVSLRLLRDERRGDELRHVLPRLARQIILVGEREEAIVAGRPLEIVRVAREAARDAARAAVVRRGREVERAELLVQSA